MAAALAVRKLCCVKSPRWILPSSTNKTANLTVTGVHNLAAQVLNVKGFAQLSSSADDTFEQDTDFVVRIEGRRRKQGGAISDD